MNLDRNSPQFKLRIPDAMHAYLKHAAIDNRRSVNSEILMRLEQTLPVDFQGDSRGQMGAVDARGQ